MKNRIVSSVLLFIALSCFAGCTNQPVTSAPTESPFTLTTYNGTPHMIVANSVDGRALGDLIVYRQLGQLVVGKIVTVRGPGVFRVEGGTFVSSSNYVGMLVPVVLK